MRTESPTNSNLIENNHAHEKKTVQLTTPFTCDIVTASHWFHLNCGVSGVFIMFHSHISCHQPTILWQSSKILWQSKNGYRHDTHVFDITILTFLTACTVQKMKFPFRISSVNVIKSAVSCGSGHTYWRKPSWKTAFFVQWLHILR